VVLGQQRGRQVLERADLAQAIGAQVVLLRVGKDQLGRDVGREEVRHVHFGDDLVVDRQAQARAVLVGAVEVDGARAHHPGTFSGLLREGSAGGHCTQNGQGQKILFHRAECGC
jgi:hypothetical protein